MTAAIVIAVAVVGLLSTRSTGTSIGAAPLATHDTIVAPATTSPAVQLSCDDVTFGEATRCSADGSDGAMIRWPDGVITASTTHAIDAVGHLDVELLVSGRVVATAAVTVTPDIDVECDEGHDDIVYEIVAWTDGEHGWGYVYVDPADGRTVLPGDDDYPIDPGLTQLDLVVVDEVVNTGRCQVISEALDAFDGSVWIEFAAPYEEPLRLPLRTPVPFSRSDWLGTQPSEMTVTISVGGIDASERRSVYASGCT